MTGLWEQRLRNIALGERFALPTAGTLTRAMDELAPVLKQTAQDPGMSGQAGMAAADSLQQAHDHAVAVRAATTRLETSIIEGNRVLDTAKSDLNALPGGKLSTRDEWVVRGAVAGATLFFPGFSLLAGEGAVQLANWFLEGRREDAAREAVERVSTSLDEVNVPQSVDVGSEDRSSRSVSTPGSSSGSRGGGGSFQNYPGFDSPSFRAGRLPDGIRMIPDGSGPYPDDFYPDPETTPVDQQRPPLVVPPTSGSGGHVNWSDVVGSGAAGNGGLVPDGSAQGGTSWGSGAAGGAGWSSASGSGGLLGSGTGGLAAGAGSAALLGGARVATRGGFGVLGGIGGGAGASGASATGSGARGGLAAGGRTGAGVGVSGVVGTGGGASGSGAGRSGGLLGGSRAGATSAASTSSAAAGAGSRGGVMAGGGSPVTGGDRDRRDGRGLAGPLAPEVEEDVDFGPRSEAAGAGSRTPAEP